MKQQVLDVLVAICLAILAAAALIAAGCSPRRPAEPEVLAVVGDRQIDWQHLQRSYELNPRWGRGLTRGEAYRNQLQSLIDEKLFALAAREQGLDKEPDMAAYLQFIQEKELIKALYLQEVASKIHISEDEYQAAYQMLKKKVQYHYICTPDSLRAAEYAARLRTESFAALQLSDAADYKGTTELRTFGEMDPAIEAFIFDMKPGEVHDPVKIDKSYFVIQLLYGRVEKFMSEMDFAEKKSKIRKTIFDRRAAGLANAYIKELMRDKNLTLNPPVFFALSEAFSRQVRPKASDEPLPIYLSDGEIQHTRLSLQELQQEVLITHKEGFLTVGEFLDKLANMPAGLRPKVSMSRELKDAIGVVVRNQYLAKRAYEKGLHKSPEVRKEIEIQQDELLSRRWLERQQAQLSVSEEEIRQFRANSNLEAINAAANRVDEEQVRNLILDYKLAALKVEQAERLSQKYRVSTNQALLASKIRDADALIEENPIKIVVRELFY